MREAFYLEVKDILKRGLPFVVYNKPDADEVYVMNQSTNDLNHFQGYHDSGFILAPFDSKNKSYLIKNDKLTKFSLQDIREINENDINIISQKIDSSDEYQNLVGKAVKKITETQIEKIVLSRKETYRVDKFDEVVAIIKLMKQYKHAFTYLFFHPKIGLWSGASPETLLLVKGNSFQTMSLAGTLPFEGNSTPTWGDKEVEEQQIVTDFIVDGLNNICNQLDVSKVSTVRAGNLCHLRTDIKGVLEEGVEDIQKVVYILHPTPAVCGVPKAESKTFILSEEPYNREFYTGYLGEVNVDNKTSLYVNIRCYHYQNKNLSIYVGGGITARSKPYQEWKETEEKSKTIKRALFFRGR